MVKPEVYSSLNTTGRWSPPSPVSPLAQPPSGSQPYIPPGYTLLHSSTHYPYMSQQTGQTSPVGRDSTSPGSPVYSSPLYSPSPVYSSNPMAMYGMQYQGYPGSDPYSRPTAPQYPHHLRHMQNSSRANEFNSPEEESPQNVYDGRMKREGDEFA